MDVSDSTLKTVLEGSKQYLVPLYQRPYAWNSNNWDQIWQDLIQLVRDQADDSGATHFTGTLVLDTASVNPELTEFLVVDGQQRLTTLSVILAALASFHEKNDDRESAKRIREQFLVNQYAKSQATRHKLKPANFDQEVYVAAVDGKVRRSSDSSIDNAFEYFQRKIQKAVDGGISYDSLETALLNGVKFVTITTKKEDNVYRIFESINNTGIALTQADLIRNLVFMKLQEDGELVHERVWLPIQRDLDSESLESLFWIDAQWRRPETRKLDTFEYQKRHIGSLSKKELIGYLENILKIANAMRRFQAADSSSNDPLEKTLGRLALLRLPSTHVLIIRISYLLETNQISYDRAVAALRSLESYLIRRSIAGVAINSLGGILASCSYGLGEDADVRVHEYLSSGKRRFIKNDEIRKQLLDSPIYNRGRRQHLQLLLQWLLEEKQGKDSINFSEHILPQSLSKSAEMEFSETVDESKDVTQVHEEVVNLIGNLTLTNYNSELSNKPFSRKRSEWLAKTSVIENHEIAKKEEWGEKEIIARCEDIAAMVCELWVGPNEKLVDSEPISSGQRIDNLVGKIPEGKWASYGDIAEVVGTSNQAVGQRLAKSQADGAWRVLRVNGQVAPGFKWDSYSEYSGKDPIQVLEEEGLVFDETGSASPDQKISLEELFELQYQSED
jgi:uncharacterized protein with ParB-like and HNH nuclease domain/alkylated DNA nucleotide flippase Atl1